MNGQVSVSYCVRLRDDILKYRLSVVRLDGWYQQPLESVKSGCLASFQGYGTTVQCRSHYASLSSPEVNGILFEIKMVNNLTTLNEL